MSDSIHAHLSKLGHREGAFRFIMSELAELKKPLLIVETGCARGREDISYVGDGMSTLFWDLLVQRYGGTGFSVDIDDRAVYIAQSQVKKFQIVCEDSIRFLRRDILPERIDFLYLDSFDFEFGSNESAIHHLCELTAVYHKLRSGCLIAVDDCHSPSQGKHVEVQKFLAGLGIRPVFEGYVTVWKKP